MCSIKKLMFALIVLEPKHLRKPNRIFYSTYSYYPRNIAFSYIFDCDTYDNYIKQYMNDPNKVIVIVNIVHMVECLKIMSRAHNKADIHYTGRRASEVTASKEPSLNLETHADFFKVLPYYEETKIETRKEKHMNMESDMNTFRTRRSSAFRNAIPNNGVKIKPIAFENKRFYSSAINGDADYGKNKPENRLDIEDVPTSLKTLPNKKIVVSRARRRPVIPVLQPHPMVSPAMRIVANIRDERKLRLSLEKDMENGLERNEKSETDSSKRKILRLPQQREIELPARHFENRARFKDTIDFEGSTERNAANIPFNAVSSTNKKNPLLSPNQHIPLIFIPKTRRRAADYFSLKDKIPKMIPILEGLRSNNPSSDQHSNLSPHQTEKSDTEFNLPRGEHETFKSVNQHHLQFNARAGNDFSTSSPRHEIIISSPIPSNIALETIPTRSFANFDDHVNDEEITHTHTEAERLKDKRMVINFEPTDNDNSGSKSFFHTPEPTVIPNLNVPHRVEIKPNDTKINLTIPDPSSPPTIVNSNLNYDTANTIRFILQQETRPMQTVPIDDGHDEGDPVSTKTDPEIFNQGITSNLELISGNDSKLDESRGDSSPPTVSTDPSTISNNYLNNETTDTSRLQTNPSYTTPLIITDARDSLKSDLAESPILTPELQPLIPKSPLLTPELQPLTPKSPLLTAELPPLTPKPTFLTPESSLISSNHESSMTEPRPSSSTDNEILLPSLIPSITAEASIQPEKYSSHLSKQKNISPRSETLHHSECEEAVDKE